MRQDNEYIGNEGESTQGAQLTAKMALNFGHIFEQKLQKEQKREDYWAPV